MIFRITRFILRLLFRLFYRWQFVGVENVPAKGGLLVVPNHASFLDPLLVGSAITCRKTRFMAKRELFKIRPFAWFIGSLGAFPVSRGAADRLALRTIFELLAQGQSVLLFPEGTRTLDGRLGEVNRGSGFIALGGKAPILPIFIKGSYQLWPKGKLLPCLFGRITISFGTPIELRATDAPDGEKDVNAWAAKRIRQELVKLEDALG